MVKGILAATLLVIASGASAQETVQPELPGGPEEVRRFPAQWTFEVLPQPSDHRVGVSIESGAGSSWKTGIVVGGLAGAAVGGGIGFMLDNFMSDGNVYWRPNTGPGALIGAGTGALLGLGIGLAVDK